MEGGSVQEQAACSKLFPGVDFTHKKETTNFKNEKQQKIFKHLITTYGKDMFDCSYVCSGAFKATVDRLSGPVGVNLVNSIRIEASSTW